MKKFLLAFIAFLIFSNTAYAQVFSQNQVIIPPFGSGVIVSTTTGTGGKLQASSSPSVGSIYATSTTATSSIAHLSATQFSIGSLSGILKAVSGYVITAFVNLASDVTGTLPIGNGGTGVASLSAGTINSNGSILYSTATTSLSVGSPLTVTGTLGALIGGSNSTINCQVASGSQAGCLASADFTTFNNKQTAGNYITALTGDVTATGPGSVAATLATVNSNVGTFIYPSVTVNGKGLITAISNGTAPTTYTATWPITLIGSAFGFNGLSTTTNLTQGFLPYVTGVNTFGQVATTSVTCSGIVTCSSFTAIGASPITINATGGGSGTVTSITLGGGLDGASPITTTGTITAQVGTSTVPALGGLAYWTGIGTPSTLGTVATGTISNGTGISVTAGQSVIGSGLTITNTSPLSGLAASFPFSFSNPTLTWLGLSTSSPGITAGQPIYATGVNTIASVASSTFLTSIGGQASGNYITALTGDVTATGPGSVAATLATVNTNTGSWGSSTAIPNFTVNGKGLITAAGTNVVIAPAGTLSGTTLNSTVITSSLTSVGTLSALTISGNLTLSALTGTQCLQEISGVVSGTGSACGSGSGGVTSVTGTYPVISSGGSTPAISLAFGTTTSNTWAGTQTFTNSPVFSTLGAGTVNSTSAGGIYNTATSTITAGSGIAYSGTMGSEIGGVSGTLSVSGLTTSNFTSANVSQFTNDAGYLTSSTGVTSLKQTYGTTQIGAITLATTSVSFNGLTVADAITNSGGTFTISPLWSGILGVAGGGTGAGTLTGCLTGNGTGAITGSGTCNTTNATVSSIVAGTGLSGGTITTSGTIAVNTTQNITTLSNLTVAGFVQTTSGGVLSSAALTSGQVTTALGFTPGQGTVTAIGVTTNQGVSGSSSGGATPNLTLTLGALTGVTSLNGLVITANTGVITTGTWNGTTIAIAHGGTNQTSFNTNAISYFDGTSLNSSTNFLWQPTADFFTVGTTTSAHSLATLATSTAPQLTLTDGVSIPWTFRSVAGSFYLATSSLTTFATSTNALFSIIPSATANATTTFSLTDFLIKQTSQTAFQIADAFGTIDALFNTASTTGSIFTVAATTSPSIYSPIKLFDVDQYGHLTASSTGATPTVVCTPSGGTLSANSNDVTGTITGGTLSTACTLTFAHTYATTPTVQTTGSNIFTGVTAQSTTAFTASMVATTGDVIQYLVVQP